MFAALKIADLGIVCDCDLGLENVWGVFIFKYLYFQTVLVKTKDTYVYVHGDVPYLFLTEGWWEPSLSLGSIPLLLPCLDHPLSRSENFPGKFSPDLTR